MSSSLTGYTHGGWAGRQRVGFENQFSQGIAGSTPASSASNFALVVQRIEHGLPEPVMPVRFWPGAPV